MSVQRTKTLDSGEFPITFSNTLGEWSRVRLWVLYSCYLNYLFFPDLRIAAPVAFGFETINFFVRLEVDRGKVGRGQLAAYVFFDIALRLVSLAVSIFLAVYMQYAFDLSPIQGLNGIGFIWFAWTFVVLRELTVYKGDYWIVVAHAMLYGLLGDTLFFFEWENYVVLGTFIAVLLMALALTQLIGYFAFLLFVFCAATTSLVYHLAGPVDTRPSFDTFLT